MSILRYRDARRERVLASPQHADGRFRNPSGLSAGLKGSPLPLLGEYFFSDAQRRPPGPLPIDDPRPGWTRPVDTGLRATWLGHSTVLLEIDGMRVLTDPVFGERASPMSFAGPRRFHEVPATIDQLPELDLVILSHDHYDHMCTSSIVALAKRGVPIVTALGVGARLEHLGVPAAQITELDWNESFTLRGLHITATPSQHFSGRGFGDRNKTLWASWVMRSDRHRVFFSGDTGLSEQFGAIGAQHGPFDLVLLEIGAFHPSWGDIHLGPANALTVFEMLGGGTLLPVHWGTFSLGLHAWNTPGEEILTFAAERNARVLTPRLGMVFEPTQLDGPTPWWRAVHGKERARLEAKPSEG
jgi:L-ascorbate metabolism protein UlaG (beta-lactamase superfamily)